MNAEQKATLAKITAYEELTGRELAFARRLVDRNALLDMVSNFVDARTAEFLEDQEEASEVEQ